MRTIKSRRRCPQCGGQKWQPWVVWPEGIALPSKSSTNATMVDHYKSFATMNRKNDTIEVDVCARCGAAVAP